MQLGHSVPIATQNGGKVQPHLPPSGRVEFLMEANLQIHRHQESLEIHPVYMLKPESCRLSQCQTLNSDALIAIYSVYTKPSLQWKVKQKREKLIYTRTRDPISQSSQHVSVHQYDYPAIQFAADYSKNTMESSDNTYDVITTKRNESYFTSKQ